MEKIEEFCYTKKDFDIEWFSGTGPGGQNRNKTQNCVRITHIPSGIASQSTIHRDRNANFRDAFNSLGEKLRPWIEAQIKLRYPSAPKSDEVIRTYHHVENRVKDHATGHQVSYDSLDSTFDQLIVKRREKFL